MVKPGDAIPTCPRLFAGLPHRDGSCGVPPAVDTPGITKQKMLPTSDDPLSSLGASVW